MATDPPHALAIARTESIALLYLLHSVPTPPSHNLVNSVKISHERYTLPFERESSLAGTLAFLSSTTDDPNYIPAVCLEEDPRSAALNVLLAINKAERDRGDQVLQRIRQGFEEIFSALARLLNSE
jgi:hypothetical protein